MRSVRFEPDLEAWLQDEARASGRSISEIVREAVRMLRQRQEGGAGPSCLERVTGAIDSGGRIDSRKTGRAYTESLKRRHSKGRNGRGK